MGEWGWGRVMLPAVGVEYLYKLFEFLMPRIFVSFSLVIICSVLYLYQYGLMDIYFILGYNPVLHFIQIILVWLLGALSVGFHVPLINLP